jgi:hypothetical protein
MLQVQRHCRFADTKVPVSLVKAIKTLDPTPIRVREAYPGAQDLQE